MKNKLLTKLISSILILIMVAAAILIIYGAVSVNSKSIFGYRLFIVQSASMSGTIEQGELIISKKANKGHLSVNDIISFVSSDPNIFGKNNTHRIINIEGENYYTKGDANDVPDTVPARYEDILGKVIWHSAFAGKAIAWVGKLENMLIFVILPTVLVAFFDIGSGLRKIKRLIKRKESDDDKPDNMTDTGEESGSDDILNILKKYNQEEIINILKKLNQEEITHILNKLAQMK